MTGQLFVVPAAAPADRHVHVALALDDGREIRFRDMRKFGRMGCWPRDPTTGAVLDAAGGRELFAGHGPEPMDDAFTLAAFRARLAARRGRLKPLLLDQGFIAGVGNIYADEALWRARLHPLRSVMTLRPADEARLHREIRAVLAEAIERRGSSIDDYTAPEGDGSMQERLQVYQRTGEACPRCGRPVRRVVVGQRATHFCSWCQRLPAWDRPGAAVILRASKALTTAPPAAATRGRRWTETATEGTLGLTPDEAARAAERGAAKARADRTRRAAATRRANARAGAGVDARAGAPRHLADAASDAAHVIVALEVESRATLTAEGTVGGVASTMPLVTR